MAARIIMKSPIGDLTIISANNYIIRIAFGAMPDENISEWLSSTGFDGALSSDCETINNMEEQLNEYFSGDRLAFDVPVMFHGTQFQRRVWLELQSVPYGRTATYGQIAANIGNPKASRAVGMANNKNRLPIIVPCHRIVGADGTLTGFAGGLDIKRRLLDLESEVTQRLSSII